MNNPSKQIVNWKNVSTTEEKITILEANCKAMIEEIKKLKVELAKKDKNETIWMPKRGKKYLCVYTDGGIYERRYDDTYNYDNNLISMNAVFESTDSVKEHLEWYRDNVLRVQNKLMQLHELLCLDYFPNWSNINENKYYIYYNHIKHNWGFTFCNTVSSNIVPFTQEAAEKACEILNKEKFMMG